MASVPSLLPVPGDVVGGRFEISGIGGEGGMATVFRARDKTNGRVVAVKVLHDPRQRARFRVECETLAVVESRHVVKHLASGDDAEGLPWLAMEWLEGEDLATRLERGALKLGEAVDLVMRVAEGLGAAHALGIVHRDVKPENILLLDGDVATPRIVDFGIVRLPGKRFTEPGLVLGTPSYFAPEQARADAALDPRSDVFALGSLLFECITGSPLWDGESIVAILTKILFEPAPPLQRVKPEVPPALADLLESMLDKDPTRRPANGAVVAEALLGIDLRDTTVLPAPPHIARRAIGEGERSIASVLVARVPKGVLTPSVSAAVRALGLRFGTTPAELADGSLAALVAGPRAATDLATIACRLALALTRLVPGAAFGIATGRATLGERSELGRVIARASALAPDTERAGVSIDAATAGLVGERFVVAPGGSALRLESELRGDKSALVHGALRGRDADVELAVTRFDEVVSRSRAGALVLIGEPGIGKTALARAIVRRLSDHASLPTVLSARGEPMRENEPFALVADLVRGAIGLGEGPDVSALDRIATWVEARVDGADSSRVAQVLSEILRIGGPERTRAGGPNIAAGTLADQAQDALSRALGAECRGVPLVLFFEDLHVADAPSLSLVASLLSQLSGEPLFVLATARPEAWQRSASLLADPSVRAIELAPLPSEVATIWAREVLGAGAATARVDDIVRSAGGNPFVLGELLRAARGGDVAPQAAVAAVHARLEALPSAVRRVLRAASVCGVFDEADIAHLMGGADVHDALETLVSEDVLVCESGPLGLRFAFRSRLFEEVAYGMLTEGDRAIAHSLAAERLAQKGGAPAALAEHLSRAGEHDRASRALAQAAREALVGSDVAAAASLAERGLALPAEREVLADLWAALAEAQLWQGQPKAAREGAGRALELAESGSFAHATALSVSLTAAARLGDVDALEELSSDIVLLDATPETASVLGHGLARAAMNLIFLGRFAAGSALITQLEELNRAMPDRSIEARVAQADSVRAHFEGDLARHFASAKRALAIFDEIGDRRTAAVVRSNLGSALRSAGKLEEAEAALKEALVTVRALGLGSIEGPLRANIGITLVRLGRIDEGLAELAAAAETFAKVSDRRLAASAALYEAEAFLAKGDREQAFSAAERALSLADAGTPLRPCALALAAEVRRASGDPTGALGYAEAAMEALGALEHVEDDEMLPHVAFIEALVGCGAHERAKEAAERAQTRLAELAERVGSAELRASFLSGVPAHRRLRELAILLGVS